MEAHRLAFTRLGGVASRCKYDRQKTVVLRFEGAQPIYNPRFTCAARPPPTRSHAPSALSGSLSGASSMAAASSTSPA